MAGKRRRTLTPEELELWSRVARQAEPIASRYHIDQSGVVGRESEAVAPIQKQASAAPASKPPRPASAATASFSPPSTAAARPAIPPAAVFDRRVARHIARGRQPIDARLDLHGLRQHDAYAALRQFLSRCQIAGHRHVLVITGKGGAGAPRGEEFWRGSERGVLRRLVPQWLKEHEFRSIAISHAEAAQHHGGGGALYIAIRRRRD